jgi:hypothetical protein
MNKSILILVAASALTSACSGGSAPQSGAADKTPGAAAAPAATPPASGTQPGASGAATPAPAGAPAQAAAQSAQQAPASATPAALPPPAGTSSAPSAAAPAPEPSAPPAPKFREVTIPAETPISVTLETPIASNKSKVEDQIRGKLAKAIIVSGTTVVPAGSQLTGSIIDAKESGRVKGKASVAFRFDRISVRGESHRIQTARVTRQAASSTKSDVKKGAIGAGAGAVIGGIAGGGSGAAIGAGVGGAGTVLATKGKEVELPTGTTVSTRLTESLKVLVPTEK